MKIAIHPPSLLLRWRQNRRDSGWSEKSFATHDPLWRETFQMLARDQLHVRLIYLSPINPQNHVDSHSAS